MSFLESMGISASALTATRLRMDVIAENIASSRTTRAGGEEPYRRRYLVYQERPSVHSRTRSGFSPDFSTSFSTPFSNYYNHTRKLSAGGGVRVIRIGEDQSEFKYDYDPTHPDADEEGYVRYPNVEVVQEMVDMMSAYRTYEANVTALNTLKDMAVKTLELGKG